MIPKLCDGSCARSVPPVALDSVEDKRRAFLETNAAERAAVVDPCTKEQIFQFFAFEHLPPHLGAVSRPFGVLARELIETLPRNPERTVALRKLLEAKDAAVRALVATE